MAGIIKQFLIVAVTLVLVYIPVSSAESEIVSQNSTPGFDGIKLWSYNVDIRSNYDYFWTAMNPSKYIMPENPIIQYYANNTDEIQIDYSPDNGDYWQNPDYTHKIKFTTPVVNVREFYTKPMFMFNDKMSIQDYDPNWMTK
ncbi:MAG: hypothetical protein D4R88_07775 [Methanosarcinales archaeon]|nr:MAG: hypothetical protein D4R88_07775 [Methanosarcinales archaeon]